MQIDRRELWKWQAGQWKSNLPAVFENLDNRLFLGDTQDGWHCLLVIEDSTQQAETSKQLSRNVGGRKVGSIIHQSVLEQTCWCPETGNPSFEHVKPIGSGLLEGKTLSLLSSNNISLIAAKIEDKSLKMHIVNGFEKTFNWELSYAPELESKSKRSNSPFQLTHATFSVINAGVVSIGPPGRSKPAIKFFTTQQGDAATTLGVMAHYISATRNDKTAAHDVKRKFTFAAPPPQPRLLLSPDIDDRTLAKNRSRPKSSGYKKAADQKRNGGGLADQATGAKPNRKSLHDQHSGADKGKEPPSGESGVASLRPDAKSGQSQSMKWE